MITLEQIDRFADRICFGNTECWGWDGPLVKGYHRFDIRSDAQKTISAAKFAYLWLVGPIPSGLVLDHLCRNTRCVNPAHLEPVTNAENQKRGLNCDLKTHCKQGHEYTPENTLVRHNGRRWCLACRKIHDRRMGQRRKLRDWASGKVKPRYPISEGV